MMAAIAARLAPYKLLFEILVIGALAAGAAVGIHEFLEHERDIGRQEVQARWDKQIAADKLAAAAQTADWQARLQAATIEGEKRNETIRSLAASAAAASGGLRDTIARVDRGMPNYSADALRDIARTYRNIFAECEGRRREVAEKLELLNSEKRTLIEAWPSRRP